MMPYVAIFMIGFLGGADSYRQEIQQLLENLKNMLNPDEIVKLFCKESPIPKMPNHLGEIANGGWQIGKGRSFQSQKN